MKRAVFGLLAGASLLAATAAVPAAADTAPVRAYWWLGQPPTGGVPAPPQVPAGGLYVASNASGASAVSAIRLVSSDGQPLDRLVLHVHMAQAADAYSFEAFPTTSTWKPGDAQPWGTQPAPLPKLTPIFGVVDTGVTSVTFDLSDLAATRLDLLIEPGVNNPGATDASAASLPTFDTSFEAPKATDVTTAAVSSPPPAPTSYGGGVSYVPGPATAPAPVPQVPATATGALVPPLPASSAAPLPAATGAPVVATPVAPVQAQARPVAVVTGRSSRDTLILAFLLADALMLMMWRARSSPGESAKAPRVSIYDLPPA